MANPILSIVIPAYKAEQTIERCLNSVYDQIKPTEKRFVEVIVVDDKSPDAVLSVLERYKLRVPELQVVAHKVNLGAAAARNTGFDRATGDFIAYLDADDTIRDGSLLSLMRILREHAPDILLHAYTYVNADGKELAASFIPDIGLVKVDCEDHDLVKTLFYFVPFGIMTPAAVYKRTTVSGLRQDPHFKIAEDRYYGWLAFRRSQSVYLAKESFVSYYQYESSLSHTVNLDGLRGVLLLNQLFLKELKSESRFRIGFRYAARRLMDGFLHWQLSEVVVLGKLQTDLIDTYFKGLGEFINSPWAVVEYKGWLPYLELARRLQSTKMMVIYRCWVDTKSRIRHYVGRIKGILTRGD